MIELVLYSIANKKSNPSIDKELLELYDYSFTPVSVKKILKHFLDTSKFGSYPGEDYLSQFLKKPEFVYTKVAEFKLEVQNTKISYKFQHEKSSVIEALNNSSSSEELANEISKISFKSSEDSVLDDYTVEYASDFFDKPRNEGIFSGIQEIDDITNGFQQGTVASFCASPGEGKSTFWMSVLFKNALEKKKCVMLSLELTPRMLWYQLQARYLSQVKGLDVSYQDLLMNKLSEEKKTQVSQYKKDFIDEIASNILILDEGILNKNLIVSYERLMKLYDEFANKLHGLDLVIWDHIGQLELMFPEKGNIAIKAITSATKLWKDSQGRQVVTGFAVQTNREGRERARKRGGQYDLKAIADLNEVERSSSYCGFLFTDDDSKLLQETKVTLVKHRLGACLTTPVVTTFLPAIITVGSSVEDITGKGDVSMSFDIDDTDFGF